MEDVGYGRAWGWKSNLGHAKMTCGDNWTKKVEKKVKKNIGEKKNTLRQKGKMK